MNKKVRLNEHQLRSAISNIVRKMLAEGYVNSNRVLKQLNESILSLNESSQDKRVQNYLKKQGYADYNRRMEIIGGLKHDIPNIRLDNNKFLLGCCRMFCERELTDEQSIRNLDNSLKFIHAGGHTDEFDENLNGKSVDELNEMFREARSNFAQGDRERSNSQTFDGKSDYRIIPINSYEEAAPYGKYTSWCVTHGEDAFKSYTQNGKRFYFCLKNGFESIPKNDANAPINEWGLSMIAVNVDSEGNLTRVTTRYNHDYNGENNPNLETTEQLENVLHVPFYQTFKPYTKEELRSMGIMTFSDAQELLNQGANPKDIFKHIYKYGNNCHVVYLNEFCNVLKDGKTIVFPNKSFDGMALYKNILELFDNGTAILYDKDNNELLFGGMTFDSVRYSNYIYPEDLLAKKNRKYNIIKEDNTILSPNLWFDDIPKYAGNNFYIVDSGDKQNWISRANGDILTPNQWYDECMGFSDGRNYAIGVIDDENAVYKVYMNGEYIQKNKTQR